MEQIKVPYCKQEVQIEVKSNCFGIIVICNLRTNANLPLGAVNLICKAEDEYLMV